MRPKALIPLAVLAALAALAGLAFAAVRVYKNDFKAKGDANELELSGKGCNAEVRGKKGQLGVTTAEGGSRCRLRLPVRGDAARPDHIVQVQGKLLPKTPEKVRKNVYLALTVREGGGGYYELRVYPERRKYSLVRRPEDEGFPVNAKDTKVGKTGEKNQLMLRAIGDEAAAKVNKAPLLAATDPAPDDLEGTRISLVLGQEGSSNDGAAVWFSNLSVKVPNP
jgi:hypothetical protein